MKSLTEYAFKNKVVVYFILLLVLLGGISSYFKMGKLEDAVFTIKTALVVTSYPGATPHEVEQEVSEVIERAVQEMSNVKEVFSSSWAGLSIVEINLEESMRSDEMPQTWDILRKKINDAYSELPAGAYPPQVIDDFGDVYGMFYAITGDGFTNEELNDYAEYIKRNMQTVSLVGKVTLFGSQNECVDIVINDAKISELGVNPGVIIQALNNQAGIAPSGNLELGENNIRVTGNLAYQNIDEIGKTLIQIGDEQIYLSDIAEIKKSYLQPERNRMLFNNNEAIGLGISTATGGNVLDLSENLKQRLEELMPNLPVGIEITPIYSEAKEVDNANNQFVVNLIESVVIVVVVLLLFMGLRSGLLIGSGLIFSILGTIIIMNGMHISMHRSSLAAIIIAMGMLVDNAIVVTDGALVDIQRGLNRKKAIISVSKLTAMPLLGATLIAILAFLPVFLAPNSAGEINHDLFLVLAISLSLSWVFAMTQTAITNEQFLKTPKTIKDPYDNKFYRLFQGFLTSVIRYKWISLGVMVAALFFGVVLFGSVKKAFFAPLEKSYTLVDYWLPEGTTINKVGSDLEQVVADLKEEFPEIVNVTTSLGETPPRYMLPVQVVKPHSSFGQLLIETHDADEAEAIKPRLRSYLSEHCPDASAQIKGYIAGPPIPYKVEARFIGPDPDVLRELSEKAKAIMHEHPECSDIKDDWRNQVLTWDPQFSELKANRVGITRSDLGAAIQRLTSSGLVIGEYRENEDKLPLVLKVDNQAQNSLESISNTGVWSRAGRTSVPLKEVVDKIDVSWQNSVIQKYNQERAITVQCNPVDPFMSGATLLSYVKNDIEAVKLPAGYKMMWAGEYKPSQEANEATGTYFPLAMLLIVLIIVMLFNNIRQSIIVILVIPLQLIGVAFGLFITNSVFGFMAIVGFLGLMGMVLKNAIVLMDQIKINLEKEGVIPFNAIINASISRMRPVFLAAATTMLGMLPLVTDPMFSSMAITIIFGLLFATLLTLIGVPLLYAIFFHVKTPKQLNA
ncbi:efflux RND transporter permease subunit [Mangrovibacterium diazotrophicum]|uniref:Multidrug efflux pump subunit AcrB n=1 Tax=Mangrovibacterium diazotrophicum TaxID=1261403 RepID=A0A419W4I6_9BACT|nr:efflux RND transporter permease subunit [Mangrovibacterium diazotrophicum]RKD90359.1 multidrug efflux pump subunit AcrB [Mangrovibacterium diazotrophicum]